MTDKKVPVTVTLTPVMMMRLRRFSGMGGKLPPKSKMSQGLRVIINAVREYRKLPDCELALDKDIKGTSTRMKRINLYVEADMVEFIKDIAMEQTGKRQVEPGVRILIETAEIMSNDKHDYFLALARREANPRYKIDPAFIDLIVEQATKPSK